MEIIKVKKRFDLCDFLNEQAYIEQMHREGKRLIAKKGSTFTFEKCEPSDYVYRIECIDTKTVDETKCIEGNADLGWELTEIKVQKSLFLVNTKYSWYYFCRKKSYNEGENEISTISARLRQCANISRLMNIEFVCLVSFAALLNILNILLADYKIFTDFFYGLVTLAVLCFTGRYLSINLGIASKIKQLLTVYTD